MEKSFFWAPGGTGGVLLHMDMEPIVLCFGVWVGQVGESARAIIFGQVRYPAAASRINSFVNLIISIPLRLNKCIGLNIYSLVQN